MKKNLSCALLAMLMLALPSLSLAKGKAMHRPMPGVDGKVTAVAEKSITVEEDQDHGGKTETLTVPEGTVIKEHDGSTAPKLAELMGKHVKVLVSPPGTAKEIIVE
jgi:flagellar basal body P-ring protein FlgI